jgi:hypothetical protein
VCALRDTVRWFASLGDLELKEKELLLLSHDFARGLFEQQKNGSP